MVESLSCREMGKGISGVIQFGGVRLILYKDF